MAEQDGIKTLKITGKNKQPILPVHWVAGVDYDFDKLNYEDAEDADDKNYDPNNKDDGDDDNDDNDDDAVPELAPRDNDNDAPDGGNADGGDEIDGKPKDDDDPIDDDDKSLLGLMPRDRVDHDNNSSDSDDNSVNPNNRAKAAKE